MARSRNIKPGLFKNEILGVADPIYTLAFQGLWLLADRDGRLEDRPLRIKAETFPYRDQIDMDALLDWLQTEGFILRYQVAGKSFLQVLNFGKHQNPHKNETESEIPAPDEIGSTPEIIGTPTEEIRSTRADSLLLIPDSLNKSSCPQPVAGDSQQAGKAESDSCPHEQIIAAYHELLPMGRQVKLWSEARRAKLRSRWREDRKRQSLDWWRKFFTYIAESDFLTGRTSTQNRGPFEIDLEWIVTSSNFVKIVEGKFENREAA